LVKGPSLIPYLLARLSFRLRDTRSKRWTLFLKIKKRYISLTRIYFNLKVISNYKYKRRLKHKLQLVVYDIRVVQVAYLSDIMVVTRV